MNVKRCVLIAISACFCCAATVAASPARARVRSPRRAQSSAASEQNPYPASAEGLRELVMDMMHTAQTGSPAALKPYLQSFNLIGSASWFAKTFGAANGAQFAAFYSAWGGMRDSQLSGDLARALAAKMTNIKVLRFAHPGDSGATADDDYFLNLRQDSEPLYVVSFSSSEGAQMRWAYFVFEDGTFRYLGPLPKLPPSSAAPATPPVAPQAQEQPEPEMPKLIRVGGNVAQTHLVHRVQPVYPPTGGALQRIEGSVMLDVIIGPDGTVQSVRVVSGKPLLAAAARAAVEQWRYQPFIINGNPVAVETAIRVGFHLAAPAANSTPATNSGAAPNVAYPPIPSYPDSNGGLSKMIKKMLDLAQHGNTKTLAAYYHTLELPNAPGWFSEQFGDANGAQFLQEYQELEPELASFFSQEFQTGNGMKFNSVDVRHYKDTCDSGASQMEYPILAARVNETQLYEVRLVSNQTFWPIFPFVYVDGGFRFLGMLKIEAPRNHFQIPTSLENEPNHGIEMPRLIHQVSPIFPYSITSTRNSEVVKIWGVIGTDGKVTDFHTIQGTCDFVKTVEDAIKKWRYVPLKIGGVPQKMIYPFQYSFSPGN